MAAVSDRTLVSSNEPQGMYGIRVTTNTGGYEYVRHTYRVVVRLDGTLEVWNSQDQIRAVFQAGTWIQAVPYNMG